MSEEPFGSARFPQRLIEEAGRVEDDRVRTVSLATIDRVLDRMGSHMVRWGTGHGDWGPWNMSRTRDALHVWDWERTADAVPVGADVLHFCFQTAAGLRSRLPVPAAASAALAAAAPQLRELGVEPEIQASLMELYLTDVLLRLEAGRSSGVPVRDALRAGLLQLLSQGMGRHMTSERSLRSISRPIAKRASRMVTVPTSRIRSLPDFLIIGGQRCGTTSLYRYLARHPAVVSAVLNKGVHYFDTDYDKGLNWYRSHFPSDPYKALVARRRNVTRVITGEGSPYYVFHPLAAARIADVLPAVKAILILRDPVTRAHSHYTHELARGFESLSFEEALEREEERLEGEEERMKTDPSYYSFSHQHHSYVARGRYLEQIERWLTVLSQGSTHDRRR